jgi:NTP pyrophosphatase (non-canonical NTP hydrolase)
MSEKDLLELRNALRAFALDRDWDQFHSPKNLAAALSVEAGELLEHFQWLKDEESRNLPDPVRQAVAEEMADVLLYLIRIADKLDVDLMEAARRKIELNAKKYPVELARGNAIKHTKLGR